MRAHYSWRHVCSVAECLEAARGDSAPFALPGTTRTHPPDRPAVVRHLHLDVTVDPETETVEGACTMLVAAVADDVSVVRFDATDLEIRDVTLDGSPEPARYDYDGDHLDVRLRKPLASGDVINIVVRYRVERPALGLYFIKPGEADPDRLTQVWSQNQDDDARYWLPCMDDPSMKMTTSVRAVVPKDFVALSNGEPASSGDAAGRDGWHAFVWQQTLPHPIYLMTLVVGPFVEQVDDSESPELRWYCLPGREQDAGRAFAKTRKMIRFFSDYLGVPYRWPRYGQVAVSEFVFGGMENTTLTTVTDQVLPDERAAIDFSADSLVAHELAHQWFGDLVTCRDWAHAWLNEGFATYLDCLFKEHDLGRDELHYELLDLARGYFQEDGERYRRPLVTREFEEPIDVFDRHLYHKGAWVLHMLRSTLGDKAFRRALNTYLTRFAFNQAETHDLQRAVEDATGRRLSWFFEPWIYEPGYPKLSWQLDRDRDSGQLTLSVEVVDAGEHELRTEVLLRRGDEERRVPIRIKKDFRTLSIAGLEGGAPEVVALDPDYTLLSPITPKAGTPQLVALLEARDVAAPRRVEAAAELAKKASGPALAALDRRLSSDDFWGLRKEVARVLGKLGTPSAQRILLEALEREKHPKVRRGVVAALAEFTGSAEAARALGELLRTGDPSYFVEAEAATSVGRLAADNAQEVLEGALQRDSFNEVVRAGALAGLGWLRTDEATDRVVDHLAPGHKTLIRVAAIRALGRAGRDEPDLRPRILDALHAHRSDEHLRIQLALISALEMIGSPDGVPTLRALHDFGHDGRVRRRAAEAQRTIRKRLDQAGAVGAFREDLERLRADYGALRDRLDRLDPR